MAQLPIANGSYVSDSLPISAQELIGLYPNLPQTEALSQETLFGTPGLVQKATTGASRTDANRESEALNDIPYFVNGGKIFRMDSDFSTTEIGVVEGAGRVSMAVNLTQLMVLVPGGKGYIVTQDPDAIVEITDVDFTTTNGKPQYVVFVDGFFVVTTDDNKFIISALNDGTTWNAPLRMR